jgi:hypothetical protein
MLAQEEVQSYIYMYSSGLQLMKSETRRNDFQFATNGFTHGVTMVRLCSEIFRC